MTTTRIGACEGKVAFDSPRHALAVCRRKNRLARREPYRCPHCGLWHVGRPLAKRFRGWKAK